MNTDEPLTQDEIDALTFGLSSPDSKALMALNAGGVMQLTARFLATFAALQSELSSLRQPWRPISEAKLDTDYLLWWAGSSLDAEKKAPPAAVRGCVSSHYPDQVWTGGEYRPLSWFTHFAPLPTAPEHEGKN